MATVQSFAFLSMRDSTRKALGLVMHDDMGYGDDFFFFWRIMINLVVPWVGRWVYT